jgi:hypothetical protein
VSAMPEIDQLISDEVLRARIRRIADAPPSKPLWERVTTNPLLIVVLSFALTWGVGTLLTNSWEQSRLDSQRVIEKEREDNAARISAFNEFFGILYEHNARAFLFEQALSRDAPLETLADLVVAERELFARSNTKIGLMHFSLRNLMSPGTYLRVVKAMDNGMYVPLQLVDQAHATAYEDKLGKRQTPKLTDFEREKSEEYSRQALLCGQKLAEAIWYSVIVRASEQDDLESTRESTLTQMDTACNPRR